jgi:hypothetical protein
MMEAEAAAAAAAIRRGWSTGKSSRPRICQRPALPHVGAGATVGTGAGRAGAPPLPVAESAGGDWSELKFNCLNINLNRLN